jgi:hypothetical protein
LATTGATGTSDAVTTGATGANDPSVSSISDGTTISVTDETLVVTGNVTGGTVTANNSTVKVDGSVTGGQIVYGTGVSSVDLANTASGTPQLRNLNDGDSVAITTPFNSATLNASDTVLTLKEGFTTVATFNVKLASGASTTFEPVKTENIGGTTYYVGTLDPPPTQINHNNVLGDLGNAKFLHGTGSTDGVTGNVVSPDVATGSFSGGTDHGEHLGLPPTLTSGQLMADLTNIGKLLGGLNQGGTSQGVGSGHPTTPNVAGYGSGALGNLDNGGKPEFKDLTSHDNNFVPKH